MSSFLSLASLALAGSAAAAVAREKFPRQAGPNDHVTTLDTVIAPSNVGPPGELSSANSLTLAPIVVKGTDTYISDPLSPEYDVTLCYGLHDTRYVNVTVSTSAGAVKLESIDSLVSVDCSADGVSMTFEDAQSLSMAYSAWSVLESVVLVTNHLGDCDTELERGFFLASKFSTVEESLTLIATAEKKTISDIGSHLQASFADLPATPDSVSLADAKRDVHHKLRNATIAKTWDLPDTTLYEQSPYITATANGSIDLSLSMAGYIDFNISTHKFDQLYVDIKATTVADVVLALELGGLAYNNTFSYKAAAGYYLVKIPGILTFGPDLELGVGAELNANMTGSVVMDIGAGIDGASLHLDLVGNTTKAQGWEPEHHASLKLSHTASLTVRPFINLAVELGFKVLGDTIDLSAGIRPEISFPMSITSDVHEGVAIEGTGLHNNATAGSTAPKSTNPSTSTSAAPAAVSSSKPLTNGTVTENHGTCFNGLGVDTDFEFKLEAFFTKYWKTNLYTYEKPIAQQCYSWN